jgi:hypothetical protein
MIWLGLIVFASPFAVVGAVVAYQLGRRFGGGTTAVVINASLGLAALWLLIYVVVTVVADPDPDELIDSWLALARLVGLLSVVAFPVALYAAWRGTQHPSATSEGVAADGRNSPP